MKKIIQQSDRHCSTQQCINCFVLNGCVYMSHAYDVPESWDIKFADDSLFKRKAPSHSAGVPVHALRTVQGR